MTWPGKVIYFGKFVLPHNNYSKKVQKRLKEVCTDDWSLDSFKPIQDYPNQFELTWFKSGSWRHNNYAPTPTPMYVYNKKK